MPFVTANDIRLWYSEAGAGPDLLLITGLGGTAQSWDNQMATFAEQYRVIAFDPRGAGRSDSPEGPYTTDMMARDAIALCDALGIQRCHVVGLGLGGMTAQTLALDFPERVHGLVLVSTLAKADAYLRRLFDSWLELLPLVGWEVLGRQMSLWTLTPDFFEHQADRLQMMETARRSKRPSPEAYRAQLAALLAHDRVAELEKITAPTLVVVGEYDIETPLRFARVLAERIPDSQLLSVADTAHRLHVENPEQFNRIVIHFLNEIEAQLQDA